MGYYYDKMKELDADGEYSWRLKLRVDIKGNINVNKLTAAIGVYMNTSHFGQSSYLVMSADTRYALMADCNDGHVSKQIRSERTFDEFYGVPIAICNKLDFEEVDIK